MQVAFLVAVWALPQGDARAVDRVMVAESVETRRSTERAVRTFEQRRLRLIPNVPSSAGGPGDVVIGRYRYAAGEADDLTPPPAEPLDIAAARRALLHTLDAASRSMPGDAWIRSRLVWYAIESGDTALAVTSARGCRDDEVPWWCDALLGLALHAAHDFLGAERAFDRSLIAMPDSTRCRWTDVSVLLDGDARKLVARTPCGERAAVNERLWWLADPFHSVPGNELRSEHFARHAFTVLHDRWRATHPLGWGSDMREIVLRYAWPIAWSRDRMRERSPAQPGYYVALTGHEPNPAYDFFPDAASLASPYDVSEKTWRFRRPRATTHYAHPLVAPLRLLRHQIARFRRGDSLMIVGAWDASDDTLFNGSAGHAALVVTSGDDDPPFMARADSATARGALTVAVPNNDHVASLELFAGRSRAAGRARHGLRALLPAKGLAVSDILLVRPGQPPRMLAEAVDRLLPDGQLDARERVTLYWEVYGLEDGALPHVRVSVSRIRAPRTRQLAERLRLRDAPQTVHADWAANARTAETVAGSLTLDLRDRPAGTWRVSIRITSGDGSTATAQRELVLGSR